MAASQNASGISTDRMLNTLSGTDLLRVAPCLLSTRNSKGRIAPVHITSSPGTGKTALVDNIARMQARMMPGIPYGIGTFNCQTAGPTDLSIVLFDEVTYPEGHPKAGQRDKVSRYTLPAVFTLSRVYISDPAAPVDGSGMSMGMSMGEVRVVTHDVMGQPIYPGALIACPFTGEHIAVLDGMLFLDEFAQGDVETRKALAPLLDEGRVTNFTLPPGFAVWAASNRAKDASGVGRALAFLTNRWISVDLARDAQGLRRYGMGIGAAESLAMAGGPILPSRAPLFDESGEWVRRPWHAAALAFAENNEDGLYGGVPHDASQPFATPRSLDLVANLMDVMLVTDPAPNPTAPGADSDSASESMAESIPSFLTAEHDPERMRMFTALAAGAMGSDMAAEFVSTLSLFGETPSIEEMAANPNTCHVSDKMDAQVVCSFKIANGMTLRNGNALVRYAQRLNPVFMANTIIAAVQRNGDLLTVSAVAKFFNDNPHTMLRMVEARAKAAGAKMAGRR